MLTENKTTELKREYVDDIKKTLIAFANTDGGILYIGIEDDGTVCGVDSADDTLLRVTNAMRDAIRPDITLFAECGYVQMEGKQVITVTMQRGTARPYYLAGKGIRPEGVFLRQGASTVPATEAAILEMIKETSGDCYEHARSLNQKLTFDYAEEYFSRKQLAFSDQQKKTLGLLGEDGTYTNLALLLSDQCVHTVKLSVFEGTLKAVFKDRREIGGSLLKQAEEAYAFIDRYNRVRAEFHGLDRTDIRDYPQEALREALLNAIVHRDYAYSGSILVSLFDDRIEIVTIGGLVRGITYEDMMLGVSISRNKQLADIFYRLRLIEAYGTGISKIFNCYRSCAQKPRLEVTSNAFKITLPNMSACASQDTPQAQVSAALSEREELILEEIKRRKSMTRKEIQDLLGVSQATTILSIKKLMEKGFLKKQGSGKDTRYSS